MQAGGLGALGQMNSNQATLHPLNTLPQSAYYRDPVTGFNVVTDIGPGFTPQVHKAVTTDIAQNFSRGATNVNYTGVFNKYNLINVPGAGYAGQNAYLSLGVVQHGTSFLARLPNGQMAKPSDFNLPYNNNGVFSPGAASYSNPYANVWNGW
jgi:hypothetical protein